jgi:hypothetical protein
MATTDFTISFTVDRSPTEVFNAINRTGGWWSGEIAGDTDRLGAEFTYNVAGTHFSRQKVTELVPGKRVVWHVTEAKIAAVKGESEWEGTDIVFEIASKGDKTELRFTHEGLAPAYECYDSCSSAWSMLVGGNLRRLITTGKDQPSPW